MARKMIRSTGGKFLRKENPGERLDRLMDQIRIDVRTAREKYDRAVKAGGKK